MCAAGAAFLYLAFANLAEQQSPGTLPLMLLFIPVGLGLLTGSRHLCWFARACMWLLIGFFAFIALGLHSGNLHTAATPDHVSAAYVVWVGLALIAATLLRIRLRWSRPGRSA